MILMLNATRCPSCGKVGSIRLDQRRCCECNARIFKTSDSFDALKRAWVISYWVFFPPNSAGHYRGWVHAGHLSETPKPNPEKYDLTPPPPGYGMKERVKRGSSKRTVQELGGKKFSPVV